MKTRAMQGETVGQVLEDGKRPWRLHKINNTILSAIYEAVNLKKAERLRECASVLGFIRGDGGLRLKSANFCRVRLCPMCAWRRSLKTFAQVEKVLQYVKSEQYAKAEGLDKPHEFAYVFLTITIKNCEGEALKETLDSMMKSWNRFLRIKRINQMCKGWFRSLEVTHNLDEDSKDYDTYHPHFHVLIAVKPSYFKSRYYISQEEFTKIWKDAARLDYDPIIDVRRVRGETAKAVAEVSKYAVKVTDYIICDDIELAEKTVAILDVALDGRRFVAFGGALKRAHQLLKLDSEDDGDLIYTDGEKPAEDDSQEVLYYTWRSGYAQYHGAKNE